mmetsp:Transcript_110493/g.323220  ORF Transcript_110493/g.323220 Transcript_110493/m.323220 type:complete len:213 (-) Transcript_110493:94-732(-)
MPCIPCSQGSLLQALGCRDRGEGHGHRSHGALGRLLCGCVDLGLAQQAAPQSLPCSIPLQRNFGLFGQGAPHRDQAPGLCFAGQHPQERGEGRGQLAICACRQQVLQAYWGSINLASRVLGLCMFHSSPRRACMPRGRVRVDLCIPVLLLTILSAHTLSACLFNASVRGTSPILVPAVFFGTCEILRFSHLAQDRHSSGCSFPRKRGKAPRL